MSTSASDVPLMCVNYLPEGVNLWLRGRDRHRGLRQFAPSWDDADPDLIDAGGQPASVITGGSVIDQADLFRPTSAAAMWTPPFSALCRLTRKATSPTGSVPGKVVPGMGGAMDLCAGVKKIVVATDHCEKSGSIQDHEEVHPASDRCQAALPISSLSAATSRSPRNGLVLQGAGSRATPSRISAPARKPTSPLPRISALWSNNPA